MRDIEEKSEKTWFEKMDEVVIGLYPNKSDAWYKDKLGEIYKNMIVNTITRN